MVAALFPAMLILRFLLVLLAVASLQAAPAPKAMPTLQRLAKPDQTGTAWSVRVPDGPLVFTGQIAASPLSGDAWAQADGALRALGTVLQGRGSDLAQIVRLTAYVGDDAAVAAVDAAVAAQFAASPVAFTLIRSPLTLPGARVQFEAVATTTRTPASVEVAESAAILPAGGKIFISGQVERGPDLGSSARVTMAGLYRSLEHVGLRKSDVVQVKAFLQPFANHEEARREIAASFGGGPVPPIVLLEWVSDIFTEIELVASAQSLPAKANESITYAWLPWLTASPRYCNIAHVMPGTPLIFIGAIDGGDISDPRTQMKTIFERLGSILFEAGSSYRNMAKATYYLNHPTARALLGDIRGVYYDPARPPAASALGVNGLGRPGRAAMVDMIAVPVK
jgi:enamine deaminase RidA (YjgF/YER057c/UK114 family)